jgi:hypothetical protein
MNNHIDSESLHRLVKQAMDSGIAESFEEAQAMFQGYRLSVEIDHEAARSESQQIVLLTVVALARRVFLGGVTVAGVTDAPHVTRMPLGARLSDAIVALGGVVSDARAPGVPAIVIGSRSDRRVGFAVRPVAAGWRGGILPAHSPLLITGGKPIPLAGMLAAALAVNEAYLHVNTGMSAAGRRAQGLSLWNPGSCADWLDEDAQEPPLTYLPSHLWLIGLGHLGQAYLWGLGLLPYAKPAELSLVLQDVDLVTGASESTSILTDATMIGTKKTRAMAAWAERRGFRTFILERLFDADFKRQPSEPAVALCGLDNAIGRQALDQVGFELIVEAGLGRGHRDFRTMRLHCLPGSRRSSEMWKAAPSAEALEDRPAYTKLVEDGTLNSCGMTLLAGKAVGAPFVGSVAATLALSEILRLLHGGPLHHLIDVDLLSLDQRATIYHTNTFATFNPGFAAADLAVNTGRNIAQ